MGPWRELEHSSIKITLLGMFLLKEYDKGMLRGGLALGALGLT
jgi:hypothetical protein